MNLAGIENANISGENFEDNELYLHRWNVVRIDGEWKGLDVTFLDEVNYYHDRTYVITYITRALKIKLMRLIREKKVGIR